VNFQQKNISLGNWFTLTNWLH